jgi:hypothetical protein
MSEERIPTTLEGGQEIQYVFKTPDGTQYIISPEDL